MNSSSEPPAPEAAWYELADELPLMQGDFIQGLTAYVQDAPGVPDDGGSADAEVESFDLSIIITQSCDLDPNQQGNTHVILCPVFTLSQLLETSGESAVQSLWDQARKGHILHLHPLRMCEIEPHAREEAMIDFRRLLELPLEATERLALEKRPWLRMKSPYREQVAQAFARRIMRVATLDNLPKWKERT